MNNRTNHFNMYVLRRFSLFVLISCILAILNAAAYDDDYCNEDDGECLSDDGKINVLIKGWINVPHSYAIVNCFHIIHLIKTFPNQYNFYYIEPPYFRPHWNQMRNLSYTEEYNNILTDYLIPYNDQIDIDIEFRISYPHDLTVYDTDDDRIVMLFYTSLGGHQNGDLMLEGHATNTISQDYVIRYLYEQKNLYFLTPSTWSAKALIAVLAESEWPARHKVITHGIDLSVFYREEDHASSVSRKAFRDRNGIKDSDILFINIGALSDNKGITIMLLAIKELVKQDKYKNIKLLLKCVQLYSCEVFLTSYLEGLEATGDISERESNNLLENHILFTDTAMTFAQLNELYNAADAYLSPYVLEGFNLPVLEAISVGLPVFVTREGSTTQYVESITSHMGLESSNKIFQLDLVIGHSIGDFRSNSRVLVASIKKNIHLLHKEIDDTYYRQLRSYLQDNYSWTAVVHMLKDHWDMLLHSK